MSEWLKEISINDLPEIYQEVARIVGIENALRLSEHLSGQLIYFPKLDGIMRVKRDKAIRQEFNGSNVRGLARKYGLTERQARNIVRKK